MRLKLSDGRIVDSKQLATMPGGNLVDFSSVKKGGDVKVLGSKGRWIGGVDITTGKGVSPLNKQDVKKWVEKGVLQYAEPQPKVKMQKIKRKGGLQR